MEELRVGMFVAGVLMAALPVGIGVALTVFLVREYRADSRSGGAPDGSLQEASGNDSQGV